MGFNSGFKGLMIEMEFERMYQDVENIKLRRGFSLPSIPNQLTGGSTMSENIYFHYYFDIFWASLSDSVNALSVLVQVLMCKSRDHASVSVSVKAETVLVLVLM